jgi:hypothetical protein
MIPRWKFRQKMKRGPIKNRSPFKLKACWSANYRALQTDFTSV